MVAHEVLWLVIAKRFPCGLISGDHVCRASLKLVGRDMCARVGGRDGAIKIGTDMRR